MWKRTLFVDVNISCHNYCKNTKEASQKAKIELLCDSSILRKQEPVLKEHSNSFLLWHCSQEVSSKVSIKGLIKCGIYSCIKKERNLVYCKDMDEIKGHYDM